METGNPSSVLAAANSPADDSDFGVVFHIHYGRIARVIARMIDDPARAEELAAEVLWRFWRSRGTPEIAKPWLYRAALHSGLDELRRQQRRRTFEALLDFRRATPNPEQLHQATQVQQQVRRVLSAMRRREAELLVLRSEGFSYQEIADIVQVNAASVGTLLRRAQTTFRNKYEKRYGKQN